MDEGLSRAVREVFVNLYEKGLIYKGNRIINWCPKCTTALSDAEVEYTEQPGHFWHIRYPVKGSDGEYVTIATTRSGDDAWRYRRGRQSGRRALSAPGRQDADSTAGGPRDSGHRRRVCGKGFGTGCVKITPCHDPNDFEVGKRHGLEEILILDGNAKIINGGKYNGMDRYEARKAIVADLEAGGYLVKIEDHVHNVGQCYRCGTTVEPITSAQWFVKMGPLTGPAIKVVEDGELKFVPERFAKNYIRWMENLHDWCISLPALVGTSHPRVVLRRLR